MTRSIRSWSDDVDCFASTDWNTFWDSFNGIEEYTTSVIGFINKCIDDVHIPTRIRIELKARAATFKERETNLDAYKKSSYHQTSKASIHN